MVKCENLCGIACTAPDGITPSMAIIIYVSDPNNPDKSIPLLACSGAGDKTWQLHCTGNPASRNYIPIQTIK